MIKVIGVRFRTAGKIYFFDPLEFEINRGDHVIVETARGIEYGTVVSGVREVEEDKVVLPLKPVLRIASERDTEQEIANKQKEKEAFEVCLEKIRSHNLDMKLIDAEYTFDNNKVLFYFTADGRIDFRELVKDLASVFKTRIELRQIGVRDETKIRGGIGICGRPLCCHSYLADFVPVSIKMAKEQNLSLNPTKISGVCGRLMCCLKNEEDTYEELNRRLPNVGDLVTTDDDIKGEVLSVNVLRQLVKVVVNVNDEKEVREYEVEKLHFKKKHGRKEKMELTKEEMMELERLEQEEKQEERETGQDRNSDRGSDCGERNNRNNDRNNDRSNDRNNDRNNDRGNDRSGERNGERSRDGHNRQERNRDNRDNRHDRQNSRNNDRNGNGNTGHDVNSGNNDNNVNNGGNDRNKEGRPNKFRHDKRNRQRDNRPHEGRDDNKQEGKAEGGEN